MCYFRERKVTLVFHLSDILVGYKICECFEFKTICIIIIISNAKIFLKFHKNKTDDIATPHLKNGRTFEGLRSLKNHIVPLSVGLSGPFGLFRYIWKLQKCLWKDMADFRVYKRGITNWLWVVLFISDLP